MSIEETLKNVGSNINREFSEALVKQTIVIPILRALDWNDTDPFELIPEFSAGDGRVDYALCQAGTPLVFIEVKKFGGANSKGEEQLFGYASNQGIPLLILTDGNTWNFYLSMAEGVPAERQFCRADLREGNVEECQKFFLAYLKKDAVLSGKSRTTAQNDNDVQRREKIASQAIPVVWADLLNQPDEMLRDLVAEAVASKCGTKPNLDDVDNFLEKQIPNSTISEQTSGQSLDLLAAPISHSSTLPVYSGKISGFKLRGESHKYPFGNRTLAEILKIFQKEDPNFMERFASCTRGRTRRLVATIRDDLYDQSDLVVFSIDMENGWWLGSNLSSRDVQKNVKIACDIAKVRYGDELTLIER